MPDLLLELRSEEIPARLQRKAAGDLRKLVTDALVEAGLSYEGAREYWTPRRLTLDIRGLTARSADVREERKGPRRDANAQAIEGFLRAGSKEKWLEVHGDTHFTHFYSNYGMGLHKRFFGHFLKGEDTGWDKQPRVSLNIRRPGENFTLRGEHEWPIARTQWTKYYLQPEGPALRAEAPTRATTLAYETTGDGITFLTPPMAHDLEVTGPVAAKLWLSSDTTDADAFLALRVFDPAGKEVTFIGSNDPRTPVGLGWLRASHRKLDPDETLPYRPFHAHDEAWPLEPGKPVELDIEIWPTSIVVPPGHRLGLTVRGTDYEVDGSDIGLANAMYPMKGVGPFTHTDPNDRPPAIFGGTNVLHFAADRMPYLLLPVIPQS